MWREMFREVHEPGMLDVKEHMIKKRCLVSIACLFHQNKGKIHVEKWEDTF